MKFLWLLILIIAETPASAQFNCHPVTVTRPSAQRNNNTGGINCILVDLNGFQLNKGQWTDTTLQLSGAALSRTEADSIVNRVRRAFAGYNVLVTESETEYLKAGKKSRVVLTGSWQWYGAAAGAAFIGSMFWQDETPCFVFTSLLSGWKMIAEATIHELGHTIGLQHQSNWLGDQKVSEYNAGNGIAAPYMGMSYGISTGGSWWLGRASDGSIQDDKAILHDRLGMIILPLHFVSFYGKEQDGSVLLRWQSDEPAQYEIQRSGDGYRFENVGSTSANKWTDRPASGRWLYRIKAGNVYSNVIRITVADMPVKAIYDLQGRYFGTSIKGLPAGIYLLVRGNGNVDNFFLTN